MEILNERIHKILENTVTELEEARNVSSKADATVMLNQMLQAANMYAEFQARLNGLKEADKQDWESPPS